MTVTSSITRANHRSIPKGDLRVTCSRSRAGGIRRAKRRKRPLPRYASLQRPPLERGAPATCYASPYVPHRRLSVSRARARRVQPRTRRAAARANGDSFAYARPYRNRNASARRDSPPYANADARPCRDSAADAPANRDRRANGAPDSAVRVPPKRPGAACANAYSSPDAPAPNGDRDARSNRDPYSRAANADAYRRPYAYADARAVRRMARRPPRRLPPRRPRARRDAHARRRLVLDDRGSRRREVRAPLLLRHVVTELRRRVSDAQRPLRRLQGRRRNRRRRLQRQRGDARAVRERQQPPLGVRRGARARPRLQRSLAIVVDGYRLGRRHPALPGLRKRRRGLLARRP